MAPAPLTPAPFAPSPLKHKTQPPAPIALATHQNHRPSLTPPSPTYPHTSPHTAPPPPRPLPWLWQCHQCHRSYALAVTRRCLDDGHYFCAGEPQASTRGRVRRGARRKSGKACASEFDYAGWRAVGTWRRTVGEVEGSGSVEGRGRRDSGIIIMQTGEPTNPGAAPTSNFDTTGKQSNERKKCYRDCDYPSECRWGREAHMQREIEEEEVREAARMLSLRVWLRRQSVEAGVGGGEGGFEGILGGAEGGEDEEEDSDVDGDSDVDMSEDGDAAEGEDEGKDLGVRRHDTQGLHEPQNVPYGAMDQMRACGYDGSDFEDHSPDFEILDEEMDVEFDGYNSSASGASR